MNDQERAELLAERLRLILPMAKGYASLDRVGSNLEIVEAAEAALQESPRPFLQPMTGEIADIERWSRMIDNPGATWTHDRVAGELGRACTHIKTLLRLYRSSQTRAVPDKFTIFGLMERHGFSGELNPFVSELLDLFAAPVPATLTEEERKFVDGATVIQRRVMAECERYDIARTNQEIVIGRLLAIIDRIAPAPAQPEVKP